MSDGNLIRILLWQNGLLHGLLSQAGKALTVTMDLEASLQLSHNIQEALNKPLPGFLKEGVKDDDVAA